MKNAVIIDLKYSLNSEFITSHGYLVLALILPVPKYMINITTTATTKLCNDNKSGVSLTFSLMAQTFSFIEGTRADCYYGCLAITEWGTLQSLSYVKL